LAAQIKIELDSYSKVFHLKIGFLFIFTILIPKINPPTNYFKATFNYAEGIEIGSDIKLAGIAIGKVTNFEINNDLVEVLGFINQDIDIPKDSTASIRSDGLFGKKSILINPGFDTPFDSSDNNINFIETADSYSIDMFLRYLTNLNE